MPARGGPATAVDCHGWDVHPGPRWRRPEYGSAAGAFRLADNLHHRDTMELELILDRCHALEQRAAAAYRSFAAAARGQPEVCALWTRLAREEEAHARSIATTRADLRLGGRSRASVHGWEEALAEIEACLAVAERLGAGATTPQQLAAALDLEMTELDALRHSLLATAHAPEPGDQNDHAEHLADVAETLTDDPQVRLQVALLRARARIQRG